MTILALEHISNLFMQVFGSPLLVGMFVLAFLVITLVILRAHAFVMLAILLPVLGVIAFASSDVIQMSPTLVIMGVFMLSFVLAVVFLSFQR